MDETQFGGPNAQEPVSRKPDGSSQLNRLSPDREAAVADYYDQACKIIGVDCPPEETPQSTNPR